MVVVVGDRGGGCSGGGEQKREENESEMIMVCLLGWIWELNRPKSLMTLATLLNVLVP